MDHSTSATTTLQALCRQEETCYKIRGKYLTTEKRYKGRKAMVSWCCTVVDYLDFERDTVVMALSCLDRYLETSVGSKCLLEPKQFKIAGMTCLYTAIKAHEPEAIEPELVVELSGGLCEMEDIEATERTILEALDWRINPPTALSFCRHLLAVVPSCVLNAHAKESLLDLAQVQTELAVCDNRLVTSPPSLVALACIFNALESQAKKQQSSDNYLETLDDLSQLFFVALSSSQHLNMDQVFDIQDVLDDIIRTHNQKTREAVEAEEAATAAKAAHNEAHERTGDDGSDSEDDNDRSDASCPNTPSANGNDKDSDSLSSSSKLGQSLFEVSPTSVCEAAEAA